MRVTESCAECLYDKQKHLSENENFLKEIRDIIDHRGEDDTSPYLVYRFQAVYEKHFGKQAPYKEIKKKYNDLVLSMEDSVREKIEGSEEPLTKALMYARVGNYVDFGAMNHVDDDTFLSLLNRAEISAKDEKVIASMISQCADADEFLLITDNCGEIVLDKLFLEQLQKRFPKLRLSVLVRGVEVLNDATQEDAEYVGISKFASVISNGLPIAGTVYDMLTDEAREAVDRADVILAKGQGNYESLCGQGRHIFYSFLCKCELFTGRFGVPKFTGVFVEENAITEGKPYMSFYKSIVDQDRCAVVICNLEHEMIYMNPAAVHHYEKWGGEKLLGKSLLECHNRESGEKIRRVVDWFLADEAHNIVYTSHNEKQNKDVYMVALREEGRLIGYYEKHEYRNAETMKFYDLW